MLKIAIYSIFLLNFALSKKNFEYEVGVVSGVKRCKVKSLSIDLKTDRELNFTEIDEEVEAFYSLDHQIKFFPSNLAEIFPNLKKIHIFNAGMIEITSNDIKNFNNLEVLVINESNIEKIEKDLFKFNKKMRRIAFINNKVRIIEEGAFDDLPELKSLTFSGNPCHGSDNESEELEVVKMKLYDECRAVD